MCFRSAWEVAATLGCLVLVVPVARATPTSPTANEVLSRVEELMAVAELEEALRLIEKELVRATDHEERAHLWHGEGVVRAAFGEPVEAFDAFVRAASVDDTLVFSRPAAKSSTTRLAECATWFVRRGHPRTAIAEYLARSVDTDPADPALNQKIRLKNEVQDDWQCPVDRIEALPKVPDPPPASPVAIAPPLPSEEGSGVSPWIWFGGGLVVAGAIAIAVAATTERGADGGSTGVVMSPLLPR